MEQSNSKKKFGLIGTSSAGKTTMCYGILHELKKLGVLADGLLQQDRRLCFDRCKLETHIEAQYAVIFNMVVKESELLLKDGTDVIVSDRSVLDFYAYLETQYGRNQMVWNFVKEWVETYAALYYLPPLAYHDDGSRPPETFRDAVDRKLVQLIEELQDEHQATNIFTLDRAGVYPSILQHIQRLMTEAEIQLIPILLNDDVLIGGSYAFNRATKTSDVDVYLSGSYPDDELRKKEAYLQGAFGARFEVKAYPHEYWEYMSTEFREIGLADARKTMKKLKSRDEVPAHLKQLLIGETK